MSITVSSVPVVSVKPDVTITMSHAEAMKLRRACYYNITVGKKFADNPVGGSAKGQEMKVFLDSLGNALKDKGVERF